MIIPASHDQEALMDVPGSKVFMKAGRSIVDLQSELKKRGLLQMEPQGSRKVQDRVVQIACLALEPEEALKRTERKKKSAARQ